MSECMLGAGSSRQKSCGEQRHRDHDSGERLHLRPPDGRLVVANYPLVEAVLVPMR
jgi:hypothetical protein